MLLTGRETVGNGSVVASAQLSADPCGSESTSSVEPRSASAWARNTAVVVLPVPPFRLATAIRTNPTFCEYCDPHTHVTVLHDSRITGDHWFPPWLEPGDSMLRLPAAPEGVFGLVPSTHAPLNPAATRITLAALRYRPAVSSWPLTRCHR